MKQSDLVLLLAREKGYHVREDGSVRGPSGKTLRTSLHQFGYPKFAIRVDELFGRRCVRTVCVHRLAALQKFGVAMFAAESVRHLDGNPENNRPGNIGIGKLSENALDIPEERRVAHAEHAAKFARKWPDTLVEQIKARREAGATYKELGEEFGVPKSTLSFMFNRAKYAR